MTFGEILVALAIGALVGLVACKLMKLNGSLLKYVILGAVGSAVGALIRWLITGVLNSWLGTLIMAIVGACLVISFCRNRAK